MPRQVHRVVNSDDRSPSGRDDLASTDEIKVYKDEGEDENKGAAGENLSEDKFGLVIETESKVRLRLGSILNLFYLTEFQIANICFS